MSKRKFNLIAVVSVRTGSRHVLTAIYSDGTGCIPSTFIDCDIPKTVWDFITRPDVGWRVLDNVTTYYKKR